MILILIYLLSIPVNIVLGYLVNKVDKESVGKLPLSVAFGISIVPVFNVIFSIILLIALLISLFGRICNSEKIQKLYECR